MNVTPIEWTDFSANPLKFRTPDGRVVWACEKISDGCKHCYAEDLSHRYGGSRRAGDWNASTMATLTPFLDEAELHKMRTYKPASGKRCFIGDMTDIFGEWVSDDLLNRLFSQTLELRTDVTWQLLTKRADRLHRYLSWRYGPSDHSPRGRIPSRHIHVGVSVENQKYADERIPLLLQTPAAVRFISAEPLLGPVDLKRHLYEARAFSTHRNGNPKAEPEHDRRPLDWVIVGGESGDDARPFDIAWARSIVHQLQAAGVPVFVKQIGSEPRNWCKAHVPEIVGDEGFERDDQGECDAEASGESGACVGRCCLLRDRKGGDPSEWPEDLRVREFPEARV